MKAPLSILMLCFFLYVLQAQDKYDYVWPNGYVSDTSLNNPAIFQGGSLMDFNKSPLELSYFRIPLWLRAYTSICDKNGQLLFYTNGCQVINREHRLMENGGGLIGGNNPNNNCSSHSYSSAQGELALPPFPGTPDLYFIFHLSTLLDHPPYYIIRDLQLTTVDASAENGLGRVIEKNRVIFHGYFADQLTAVRHANGRDWWIVAPKMLSNTYFIWLFTPQGLQGPMEQSIGSVWTWRDWGGQAVFSPDGSKYARANFENGLHLMDFDRCNGVFSNSVRIKSELPLNDTGPTGVGFSPSSRYLYLSWSIRLFQFDLRAANISNSRTTVGTAQHYSFFQQRLAPDGKIYMSSSIGMNYLHVIHQPDNPGMSCSFEEIGLTLPTRRSFNMPNLPWFRLYELPGSPCDTLRVQVPPVVRITVAPNPAYDELRVSLSEIYAGRPALFRLYDALGHLVYHARWEADSYTLVADVSNLPAAMYFWEVLSEAERLGQGKVVVAR
ncbi:MAG: hypothetical protein KF852_14740 [Saprospiraceae bacterium]|nr:hypothetical protein [Saprospiraceae bacterium]